MKRLRAVVVEDEALAREVVCSLLSRDREVEVVGEASGGAEGLELIRQLRPDLAFLDVEMPGMTGVEVARSLDAAQRPAIVFITAYGEFATDAFDLEALDYVVKPFSDDRFFAALARVKARLKEHRLSDLMQQAASEVSESSDDEASLDDGHLRTLAVRSQGRSRLIRVTDLLWIESADYYARLHTARGSHLIRTPLATLEERLDPRRFLRVHRGAIVNIEAVVAVEHLPKGAQIVVLSDGTRCRVSRSRKSVVDAVLLPTVS